MSCRIARDPLHPAHPRLAIMSAQIFAPSLANNLRIGTLSARSGVAALEGLGAPSDSFSRTLDQRMRAPDPAPRPAEHARAPERPTTTPNPAREPERSAAEGSLSASTERPQRGNENGAGDPPADQPTTSGQTDANATAAQDTATGQTTETDSADGTDGTAATAARNDGAWGALAGDPAGALAAASAETLAGASDDEAAAVAPTDPAALAGLPAAIAALLAGRAEAPVSEGEHGALQLAAEGGRKSLQNSALLPKTDLSAQMGGGNGSGSAATPAFLLQGREFAAAAAARSMAGAPGAQALAGEAATGSATPPAGLMQSHAPLQMLRHAPATQPATPQLPVATPAGEAGWAEDVGNQVRWMLGRAESKAELVLTPPNMGKLEVSINLAGDQTTAQFIASNQAARDALERAMPQLREALQQAGITLGDASVSTSSQGRDGEGQQGRSGRGGNGDTAAAEGPGGGNAGGWVKQHQGMVDTFA